MSKSESLVLPSKIPWNSIKGHALEECVYWLLDALGAKSIDWRVGGSGSGTADGGRDLECVFHIPVPSNEILTQKWWVEVKGRAATVAPSDIKESVVTAAGKPEVDVHLIVTNQQLSNPTKDWLADWRKEHRRPEIRIWEKQDLERLVSKNPSVALRVFPQALTAEGKCEVMTSRFWEFVSFTDVPTLETLWQSRHDFEWTTRSMFAALASECAIGDLAERPWGTLLSPDRLVETYINGLVNTFYLLFRADAAGVRLDPVVDALAHLLTHLIALFDPTIVARMTEGSFDTTDNLSDLPPAARRFIIQPVLSRAFHQAADACLSDCDRVMGRWSSRVNEKPTTYWQRFKEAPPKKSAEPDDDRTFYIESLKGLCNVGLPLSDKVTCPMLNFDEDQPVKKVIERIRTVIISRTGLQPLIQPKKKRVSSKSRKK